MSSRKFLNYIISFLIVTFTIGNPLFAQNQKIGYIDSEYILGKIPEYRGISERMNQLTQQWQDELTKLEQGLQTLQEDYDAREILYTEEIKKEKLAEIETARNKVNSYKKQKFGPQGDYYKQQQDLLEPLQQRILEAINKIAERDDFDFIFDRTGDYLFLYTKAQWNLSDDVLLELGIEFDN